MNLVGLFAFLLISLQTPASAPLFSGSWTLDPTRSVLHPSGARAIDLEVVDRAIEVAVEFRFRKVIDKYACSTDGELCKQTVGGGDVYARSLRRQNGALLWRVKMTRASDQASIEYTERWSLSDEGETLTIDQLFPGPREIIQVFTRKSDSRKRAK
jgi:hypothetical protein